MDWGLKNRIARIISPADNKALMLAVDHGYFLGPTEKLEDLKKTIAPLAKHCDSLMITRGALRTSVNPDYPVPVVLRVSGGTSIIGEDLSQEDITVSIKDALRLNVAAVAMSVFVGSKYEYQTIVNLGKLVNEAEEYGIPVLAVTAVGKEIGTKDARYLSLACRVAAEQGAHIVKTYYCENFEKRTYIKKMKKGKKMFIFLLKYQFSPIFPPSLGSCDSTILSQILSRYLKLSVTIDTYFRTDDTSIFEFESVQ